MSLRKQRHFVSFVSPGEYSIVRQLHRKGQDGNGACGFRHPPSHLTLCRLHHFYKTNTWKALRPLTDFAEQSPFLSLEGNRKSELNVELRFLLERLNLSSFRIPT